MLVKEVIQRIQSLYSKGSQSDDTRLKRRHIYNKMLTVRSKLITEEANKKQKLNQWNFQTLPCVELIKAPVHECPCLPPAGCLIYRTKEKLPKPIADLNRHLIQSVTSLDGTVVFSEITWLEKKYKASNKYTASKPDYYIRNNYLYVTQRKGATIISITGLFEDPVLAETYASACDDTPCQGDDCVDCSSPLDAEFPLDDDKLDTLVQLCAEELLLVFNQGREDLANDTKDSPKEEGK